MLRWWLFGLLMLVPSFVWAVDVAIVTTAEINRTQQSGAPSIHACTSSTTCYVFYPLEADDDGYYIKTTDGGATWGTPVLFLTGNALRLSIWHDKWTPGNSGTKIHLAYTDGGTNDLLYRALNTNGDSLGTQVNLTNQATTIGSGGMTAITVARGGNIVICSLSDVTGVVEGCFRSTDSGASFGSIASALEGDVLDKIQLYPGGDADNQDVWALFDDVSADALTLKVYDDSANSWSEAAIAAMIETTSGTAWPQFCGAVRHSNNHLYVALWNDYDTATADLLTYDVTNAGTITQTGSLDTDTDDSFACAMQIDQNTGSTVRVGYLGTDDGTQTALATVQVYYKTSTDSMATFGAQQAFSEDIADDFRSLSVDMGGTSTLFAPSWFDDDDNILYTGVTNAVAVTPPAAGGAPLGSMGMMGVGR